ITTDDDTARGLRLGARMVITKPLATGEALEQTIAAIKRHADEATRELLIVEPSAARREQLVALLDGPDVSVTAVGTGADATAAQRTTLSDLHVGSRALGGKKALIVDDDIRNIFALTSVLEEHHMLVVSAENGRDAIKTLQAYADIDVVVMDIMMPQMDGMET